MIETRWRLRSPLGATSASGLESQAYAAPGHSRRPLGEIPWRDYSPAVTAFPEAETASAASFPTVRVAAVQATPRILDAAGSIEKAVGLLADCAERGAQLAVLPEAFVPLYPSNSWARGASSFSGWDELWERLWENSVDVPGPLVERLINACRETGLHCAIGVNERESERPGTIYNTLLLLGPQGLLWRHRKLMPTHHERLFHGIGAGDDLTVTPTPVGRIGGLICWENRMPLARHAVYRKGPQIWVAPTADDSDSWIASMRHIAIESGAFVVSVPQFIPRSAFPDDFPVPLAAGDDALGNGGAVIVEPDNGKVIAGPLYGDEAILVADCDLRVGLHAKRWFDAVGHYGREDVLAQSGPRMSEPSASEPSE
jgi:nitrilase